VSDLKPGTILFQGDSITDGGRDREGHLSHHLGQGYPFIIAGLLGNRMAGEGWQFVNRGISGNRVSDVYARWNEDAISIRPDWLSILIGVNDAWRIMKGLPTGATDRFERAYRHLLTETNEVLPDTTLILLEPFVLKASATEERWEEWRAKLDEYGRITRELAQEYGAIFVPLQAAFDRATKRAPAAYWLHDGVHPTAAGHDLIAGEWLAAVGIERE